MPRSHSRYFDACRAALRCAVATRTVQCVVLLPDGRYHVWPTARHDRRWPERFTVATPDGTIITDGTIVVARELGVHRED